MKNKQIWYCWKSGRRTWVKHDGTIKSQPPMLWLKCSMIYLLRCSGTVDFSPAAFFYFLLSYLQKVAVIKINPIRAPLSLCCILMSLRVAPSCLGHSASSNAFTKADCWCSAAVLMFVLALVKHDAPSKQIFHSASLDSLESEMERFFGKFWRGGHFQLGAWLSHVK